MFGYLSCSMKRRKAANLITVGISVMLVLLLNLYFGNIRSYQTQLSDLAGNVPIFCQITNLNGTLVNSLFISENTVKALEQSDQIKDLSYMTVLMAGEGDFTDAEYSKHLNLHVVGANRAEAVGDLTNDMIHMDSKDIDSFFSSDNMECIVNENVLKKRGWKIGDQITLKYYYYDPASELHKIEIHPMGEAVEVTITGTMDEIAGKTNAIRTDIVMPAKAAWNLFSKFDLKFFADTVTFHIANPLQLNAFKEEMRNIGLMETSAEAGDSYTGCALITRDAEFIASATDLQRSIALLQSFFPVVCILVLMIGYVVSYLSGNNRRDEFSLLRLQGVKKTKASLIFLVEQMILVLTGNFLGDAVMTLTAPAFAVMLLVNGVILAAYLIGAAAAYGQMSRGSVLYLLSVQQ
ncbi:MAG: hypothetical protein K2O15_05680 [Lachnospiraceae bacterium]|nr:hypothetical protein [Lachnospiraceae bacterium]